MDKRSPKIKNILVIMLIVIGIIIFPFFLDWFLHHTPIISGMSNEAWFSFIGSYVGAVVTIAVMFVTFKKSKEENMKAVELQKKQHRIEKQRKEIDRIIHVLLLDNYIFTNIDTVQDNFYKFRKDFQYIQLDTLLLGEEYPELKNENLRNELISLQMKEVEILNKLSIEAPHVDSPQKANEFLMVLLRQCCELNKIANLHREIVKVMYESYMKKLYEKYFD